MINNSTGKCWSSYSQSTSTWNTGMISIFTGSAGLNIAGHFLSGAQVRLLFLLVVVLFIQQVNFTWSTDMISISTGLAGLHIAGQRLPGAQA